MGKNYCIKFLVFCTLTLFICACGSSNKVVVKNNRTLLLTNKYLEESPDKITTTTVPESITDNGFTSWYCRDKYTGNIIFEFGYFTHNSVELGFVLYDGTDKGAFVLYYRNGLDHRWDWDKFSFVITPEGEGLYYDFHSVPYGEKTTPKQIYEVIKRKN